MPKRKLLIITPPKTASTSLADLLCLRNQGILIYGPRIDRFGQELCDKHTTKIPEDLLREAFKLVCVVRNPYTRACSLWGYANKVNRGKKTKCSLQDFINNSILSSNHNYFNISTIIKDVDSRINEYWKMENLREHLREHDLPAQISVLNRSKSSNDEGIDLSLINPWAIPDCEKFDYPIIR